MDDLLQCNNMPKESSMVIYYNVTTMPKKKKSLRFAVKWANANRNQLYIKQKYSLTIPPNYIMDPVLLISKRDLAIANIHLPTVTKETQSSYQKKFGEQRIMTLSCL